jgi:hypothetical protein
MPSPTNKRFIILGAFLVLLGVLFIAVKNYWLSMFGFLIGIIGIVVLIAAIPRAGGSGQKPA